MLRIKKIFDLKELEKFEFKFNIMASLIFLIFFIPIYFIYKLCGFEFTAIGLLSFIAVENFFKN